MMSKELKAEAKSYAKRKFSEKEQAYLHDIIAQAYYDGVEPREKRIIRLMASLSDVSVKSALRIVKLEKQLDKAKALLAKWIELFRPKLEGYPKTPVQIATEQFLKEL